MSIRPIEKKDQAMISQLIAGNPFKDYQIKAQCLDREKLVQFHTDRILKQSLDPDSPVWMVEGYGRSALLGFSFSSNHTTYFGRSIVSLGPILTYLLPKRAKEHCLQELGEILEYRSVDVIWCKCDEEEGDLATCFSVLGADYCGTSVRMTRWIGQTDNPVENPDIKIREVRAEDLSQLQDIAAMSHHHSHFFRDPNLPEDKRLRVFPTYLARCMGQPLRPFHLAEDRDGRILGFSLLLCPQNQLEQIGQTVGIVDFIAVDPSFQGKGIGSLLLTHSLRLLREKGYELVELKTMLDNLNAIAFYQKYGFHILSSEMHFSIGRGTPEPIH